MAAPKYFRRCEREFCTASEAETEKTRRSHDVILSSLNFFPLLSRPSRDGMTFVCQIVVVVVVVDQSIYLFSCVCMNVASSCVCYVCMFVISVTNSPINCDTPCGTNAFHLRSALVTCCSRTYSRTSLVFSLPSSRVMKTHTHTLSLYTPICVLAHCTGRTTGGIWRRCSRALRLGELREEREWRGDGEQRQGER